MAVVSVLGLRFLIYIFQMLSLYNQVVFFLAILSNGENRTHLEYSWKDNENGLSYCAVNGFHSGVLRVSNYIPMSSSLTM